MDSKLTLKLDSYVIKNAKLYAKEKNISLSQLIESYLGFLTNTKHTDEITPLVKSLSGIVSLPKNTDTKKEYKKHVLKKHSK